MNTEYVYPSTLVTCSYCGKKFLKRNKDIKEGRNTFCSRKCQGLHKTSNHKIKLICSYCGKEFNRDISKLKNSKSKLYFCSKKCKNNAQKCEAKILNKSTIRKDYRITAFLNKEQKCEICNNDDLRVLEVHHINNNHNDNRIENLMILCANCHKIIHYTKAD